MLEALGDSFKNEDGDDGVVVGDVLSELEKLKRQMDVVEKAFSKLANTKTKERK